MRALGRHFLQKINSLSVPAAESLDDQRLEKYSLSMAGVEVVAVFAGLARFDGGGGGLGSMVDESVLCR